MLFSLKDNKELFALARENNVLLMEALKSVFLPINIRIKKMVKDKAIGDIKEIYAAFMRNGSHGEDHWINDPKCGGAFADLGSYCVGTMNFIMDKEPVMIEKTTNRTVTKADSSTRAIIDYDGVKGIASVSNSEDGDCCLQVKGDKGLIRVENFWKTGKGYYEVDNERYELDEECISDFYYELKHFNDLVDNRIIESDVMNEKASADILKITENK